MSAVSLFLTGVAVTAAISLAVVRYLKPSLQDVLEDLCGTPTRASFWTAFSTVTVVLTPIMFALHYRPDVAAAHAIFEIGSQLEWALGGLLLSVILLGLVLAKFIPREPPAHA